MSGEDIALYPYSGGAGAVFHSEDGMVGKRTAVEVCLTARQRCNPCASDGNLGLSVLSPKWLTLGRWGHSTELEAGSIVRCTGHCQPLKWQWALQSCLQGCDRRTLTRWHWQPVPVPGVLNGMETKWMEVKEPFGQGRSHVVWAITDYI